MPVAINPAVEDPLPLIIIFLAAVSQVNVSARVRVTPVVLAARLVLIWTVLVVRVPETIHVIPPVKLAVIPEYKVTLPDIVSP